MAKGEARNPAEAHRKALKKKELKKNKVERVKARELSTVKTDTTVFEEEIAELESKTSRTAKESQRLENLRTEIARVQKKKEEYVTQHPEHRKLVYRSVRKQDQELPKLTAKRNIFDERGRPRHPERSIYYDAVFNPYGAPPPGMPYMERPPLPGEQYSDQEDVSDAGDDDIPMPDSPPPDAGNESDDDIELPEGPPPNRGTDIPLEIPSGPPPLPQLQGGIARPIPFISHTPVFYPPAKESTLSGTTLPAKPSSANASRTTVSATISAEPELRDFKRESTAFIPSALKRKKPVVPKVDSRPDIEVSDSKPVVLEERPNLLKTLQSRLAQSGTSKN